MIESRVIKFDLVGSRENWEIESDRIQRRLHVLEMLRSVDRMNRAIFDGDREAYRKEIIRQANLRARLEELETRDQIERMNEVIADDSQWPEENR